MTVIWFSYERDHLPLIQSLKAAAQALPGAAFVVVDDDLWPMSQESRQQVADHGARLLTSSLARGCNLRGDEWIVEQLRLMEQAAREDGSKTILKLDPDTLLLRPYWLNPILKGEVSALGWWTGQPVIRHWFGCAYALDVELLSPIAQDIARYCLWHQAPEDLAISLTARRILDQQGRPDQWQRRIMRSALSPDTLGLASHNWTSEQRPRHLDNDVIQFGPNPSGQASSREHQAQTMAQTLSSFLASQAACKHPAR